MKLHAWIVVFALTLVLVGCQNRGVKVTCSSSSTTSIGDINWDEYKIPVVGVYTGPRLVVWVNKDYLALSEVKAWGAVTNDTAALGIYSDKQKKQAAVEMKFLPVTNLVTTAEVETK